MRDPLFAPADLALYGEPCCTPAHAVGPRRWLLRGVGVAASGLAVAGAVLPLLPATPFALVAAWAFARSSPRMQAWLTGHPRLGPALEAWRGRRAIPRPAKAAAVVSLPTSWALLWLAQPGLIPLMLSAAVLVVVGTWILTRPS